MSIIDEHSETNSRRGFWWLIPSLAISVIPVVGVVWITFSPITVPVGKKQIQGFSLTIDAEPNLTMNNIGDGWVFSASLPFNLRTYFVSYLPPPALTPDSLHEE